MLPVLSRHFRDSRRVRRVLAGCVAAVLIAGACEPGAPLVSPDVPRSGRTQLGFTPRYSYLGARNGSSAADINNIRLTARDQRSGAVLARQVFTVDPSSNGWNLSLDLSLTNSEQVVVIVTIELLNVTNGVETVQWSGLTDPLPVTPGANQQPAPVQLFQGPPDNLQVTAVSVSPGSARITEGASTVLSADVSGGGSSVRVFWSSLDPDVATVDDGAVHGVLPGSARIVAVAGPRADTARVTVTARPVAVRVSPDSVRLSTMGAEAEFSARIVDARGNEAGEQDVTWSAEDVGATSLGGGRFRATATGRITIVATSASNPSLRGTATLVVAPEISALSIQPGEARIGAIGAHQAFSVVARDATGAAIPAHVTWSSSNENVATIDANGDAIAVAPGTTTIRAVTSRLTGTGLSVNAEDDIEATATLTVAPAPVSIEVQLASSTLQAVGETTVATARVLDANGNVIPDAHVAWTSTNAAVASVDDAGTVQAVANGSATIRAASEGVTGEAIVEVVQRVARVVVTPPAATLTNAGDTARFTASARDSNNNNVSGQAFVWSSSNGGVASVDAEGLVTAVANGTTTITALTEGASGTASVTVNISALPNLQGQAIVDPADTTVMINDLADDVLYVAVRNAGNGAAAASHGVFKVRDASNDDVVVAFGFDIPALGPGQAIELPVPVENLPTMLPPRIYGEVRIDDANAVTESDENDNITRTQTVRVIPATAIVLVGGDNQNGTTGQPLPELLKVKVVDPLGNGVEGIRVTWFPVTPNAGTFDPVSSLTNADGIAATQWHAGPVTGAAEVEARAEDLTGSPVAFHATIAPVQMPELAIQQLTYGPAGARPLRDTLRIEFKVSNNGTATAGASHARVQVRNRDGGAVLHEETIATPELAAGTAAQPAQLDLPVPGTWPDSIDVRLVVDADNEVDESDEPNNIFVGAALKIRHSRAVRATPDTVRLSVGQNVPLTVRALDAQNAEIPGAQLAFATLDGNVATISETGLVQGIAPGTTSVIATSGAFSDTSAVIVAPLPIVDLTAQLYIVPGLLRPSLDQLHIGLRVRNAGNAQSGVTHARVRVRDHAAPATVLHESLVEIPALPAGASSDSLGVNVAVAEQWPDAVDVELVADANGEAGESDEANNVASSQSIPIRHIGSVVSSPDTLYLQAGGDGTIDAHGYDRQGGEITDLPISFQSLDADVATVGDAGNVHANAIGTALVVVGMGDVRDTTAVVATSSVSRIAITTTDTVINALTFTRQLDVDTRNEFDIVAPVPSLLWESSDEAIASVSQTGLVTAHAPGTVQISATVQQAIAGRTSFARAARIVQPDGAPRAQRTIVVRQIPLELVPTEGLSLNLAAGDSAALGAVVRDSAHVVIQGAPITATSSDTSRVRTANNKVFGRKRGDAAVTLASGPVSRAISVSVRPGPARGLQRHGGDGQVQIVANALTGEIQAFVTDGFDNPVEGARVAFKVQGGHGGGGVTRDTVATDADGIATTGWTLGTLAGVHRLTAELVGTNERVEFTASAKHGPKSASNRNRGDGQITIVATDAPDRLEVKVTDEYGNAVDGETVTFSVDDPGNHGGGTVDPASAVTDADGIAGTTFTLGTKAGAHKVIAHVDGLDDVSFNLNGRAGPPRNLGRVRGGGVTAVVSPTLSDVLEVRVSDQYDNPVADATVEWSIREGNGSIPAGTSLTDANGQASIVWTLGTKAMTHKLQVSVNGVPAAVEFSSRPHAGPLHRATMSPRNPKLKSKTEQVTFSYTAFDEFDNPVEDPITPTWSSDAPANVTIDRTTGVATGIKNGRAKIKLSLSSNGVTLTDETDSELEQELAILELEGLTLTALQLEQELRHIQKDAKGQAMDVAVPVTFTSLTPEIVTVDANGKVKSVSAGTGQVLVSAGAVSATVNVVVDPQPGNGRHMEIRQGTSTIRNSITIAPGTTLNLIGYIEDSKGFPITSGKFTWQLLNLPVQDLALIQATSRNTATIITDPRYSNTTFKIRVTRGGESAEITVTILLNGS